MAYINKKTLETCNVNYCSDYNEDDYFEVDENIALVIVELNKKGYITAYCCSGHIFNDQSDDELMLLSGSIITADGEVIEVTENNNTKVHRYIRINDSNNYCYILFEFCHNFDNLPKGFICIEDEQNRTIIEKNYNSEDGTLERGLDIITTMSDLYNWVNSLDVIVSS